MKKSKQEPAYDSWAEFYDATDADRTPFIDFYRGLVGQSMDSLLDLGCGTGTITIALARQLSESSGDAGTRIVGVDESTQMLRVANDRAHDLEWIPGDMRSPPVEGRFDLVISCFNSLQSLVRDDDLGQTFAAVRRLIKDDGIFAFDIYRPNLEYLGSSHTNRLARSVTDDQGRRLEIREDTRYDSGSQVLTIDWRLQEEGKGEAAPLAVAQFSMRQYFPAETIRILEASGLVVRERYGDFDRSAFTEDSKRQVLVCAAG